MKEEEKKVYEDATWGNYGKDIVTSRYYQVYKVKGVWLGDDESLWYDFDKKNHSECTIDPEAYVNYEFNKYGQTKDGEDISVTIVPNVTLKKQNPLAQVKIDDKFYDLGILAKPIKLFMNKDHRISILWTPELVETFRIIKLK